MLRQGVQLATVMLVLLGATVLSWGLGRWWVSGGRTLMEIGWLPGGLLIGMALVVVATGSRMWRMRRGETHVEPLVAARLLGLAQASALTGAVTGGLYLGQALVLLPDLDFAGRGALAARMAFAGLGGLLMSGAGLLVQRWCRIGDEDEEEGDEDR